MTRSDAGRGVVIERKRDDGERTELIAAFRELIAEIVTTPKQPRGFDLDVRGRMAAPTGADTFPMVRWGL